jgi:hypothetical protein
VPEEEPLNFMRIGILQFLSGWDLIPFREPSVEHPVDHNIGDGLMVGVHARAECRKHHARPVFP